MAQTGYVNRNGGFVVASQRAIDRRMLLSKAEMKSVNANGLGKFSNGESFAVPDTYFCVCSNDGKFYLFDKNTTDLSDETGRYACLDKAIVKDPEFQTSVENVIEDSPTIADIQETIETLSVDGGAI